jgi:hypothetical protein
MSVRELARRAVLRAPWPVAPLVERLYLARNEEVYRTEAVEGLVIEIGAPRQSQLWRKRFGRPAGHEAGVCRWLIERLRPDDVFYDVGAHFGFYPTLVDTIQPTAEVHCFEPAIGLVKFIYGNRRRRGAQRRWTIVEKLVGDADTHAMVTLDAYARSAGRPPTIVKIDVEGAEVTVLRGARELVARRQTEFLVELHPEAMPGFGQSVDEFLASFGDFRLSVLDDIREGDAPVWSDDLDLARHGHQTYLYAAPSERARH